MCIPYVRHTDRNLQRQVPGPADAFIQLPPARAGRHLVCDIDGSRYLDQVGRYWRQFAGKPASHRFAVQHDPVTELDRARRVAWDNEPGSGA
jgi:hypothetical protein